MNNTGYSDVVIGAQYGDEGKARIIDILAREYDIVARFNGGANAGHTVEVGNTKIALHQIPCGVFYPEKKLYIGSGCSINVIKLAEEIERLEALKIQFDGRLHISSQASIIQPHQVVLDSLIGKAVGTTKNGIGPSYADRALRMWGERLLNIRLGDLLDKPDVFLKNVMENALAARDMYGLALGNLEHDIEALKRALYDVKSYIERDTLFLQKQVQSGKKVIFEGAQSYMLDVVKGAVPFVTSSHTTAAAAYVGGDVSPEFHRKTIGVAKAIMSRVGHGPFVSEFGGQKSEEYCMKLNPDGTPTYGRSVENSYDVETLLRSTDPFEFSQAVRILSSEYGTVTGRPRRVGALDLVLLKQAVSMNGMKELILTKCDLLNIFSRSRRGMIPLVTAYKLDGETLDYVPGSASTYSRTEAILEYRESFTEDISRMREYSNLHPALKNIIAEVENRTGCKIRLIGVGPERDQFIPINQ